MAQSPIVRVRPTNDVYTFFVITSCALVAGTIAFVIFRSIDLFGTAFPGFAS